LATRTLGTNSTSSLTAIRWNIDSSGTGTVSAADFASIVNGILDDYYAGTGRPATPPASPRIYPGGMMSGGMYARLWIPNRAQSFLLVKPGDVVAIDSTTGWPILVGSNAIANGPWTLSGSGTP